MHGFLRRSTWAIGGALIALGAVMAATPSGAGPRSGAGGGTPSPCDPDLLSAPTPSPTAPKAPGTIPDLDVQQTASAPEHAPGSPEFPAGADQASAEAAAPASDAGAAPQVARAPKPMMTATVRDQSQAVSIDALRGATGPCYATAEPPPVTRKAVKTRSNIQNN